MMVTVKYTRDHLPEMEIGLHTYGIPEIIGGGPGARLVIGRYCSIADGVQFLLAGDHHINRVTSYPFENIDGWDFQEELHPFHRPNYIDIGNDVLLGYGSRILHGIRIGDGAVIGAYAVVTKDVRPYAIVGGNPAREIRRRFDDETITKLLSIRWWDWEESKIRANMDIITSPDVEALCSIS